MFKIDYKKIRHFLYMYPLHYLVAFFLFSSYLVGATLTQTVIVSSTGTVNYPTEQVVISFTLINADNDQPITTFDPLINNATLNLASLPSKNLNIRANTEPFTVGSIRFRLDDDPNFRIENSSPYALAGDSPPGDYSAWTPSLGWHIISATPYTEPSGSGSIGTPLTINFNVVNISGHDSPLPGQIIVDPQHPEWLKYHQGGPFFMCGPGDPEGFLYRGTRNPNGTRNGDQIQLIEKLKQTGSNSIYLMCIRSHGGDGDSSQNPFIDGEPIKGLDYGILNQWEQWFAEMDNNGIVIFFIFYDDSAKIWDTGDAVGPEESDFIEGIVNEFEHHKNIIWVIAEEYTEAYTTIRVSNIASKIRASDDHDHVIAVHKTTGLSFSEFADDPNIDQFAIQYHGNASVLHNAMITAWNNANGKYNLNLAESGEHGTGEELRKKNWAIAMGGAYIMVYQMDIADTEVSDLQGCGYLVDFFESTSVNEMEPRDDLAFGGTEYVLAYPENSYIAYASSLVGDIGLKNMAAGTYDFKWYDAADGTTVIQEGIDVASGDRTWSKPVIIGNELAVYVNRTGDLQQERVFPGVTWEFKMPTEVGLNSSKLDEFVNNLGGRGSIVRHGYMVKTWGDQAFNHEWKSSSKPVFSTMLFFAIKEGKVASVDELITDWGWDLIPKDQMMTFSHLANMVSGYARGEEPGAAYAYNDYAIQLYGETLFERVFNEETPNAVVTAATRLGALEFEDGSIMLENYRVVASVRDFARICWFWLNKGNWNDEQLLSTSFFNDYMKPWVADDLPRTTEAGSDYLGIGTLGGGVDQDYPGQGIYGFNWWFNPNQSAWPDAPEDMIVTFGYGGNNCIIIPSLDLIVVADGNWGSFDPGNPEAGWNQNLKLLMQAVN